MKVLHNEWHCNAQIFALQPRMIWLASFTPTWMLNLPHHSNCGGIPYSVSIPPSIWINLTARLDVYTAATVLLAARIKPVIEVGIVNYSLSESWEHAIAILKCYEGYGDSAQRCRATLELLAAKIPETTESDTAHSHRHPDPHVNTASNEYLEADVQSQDVGMDFDLAGITFDVNDISWLNSMAGNL
jgi:hypothetical protein